MLDDFVSQLWILPSHTIALLSTFWASVRVPSHISPQHHALYKGIFAIWIIKLHILWIQIFLAISPEQRDSRMGQVFNLPLCLSLNLQVNWSSTRVSQIPIRNLLLFFFCVYCGGWLIFWFRVGLVQLRLCNEFPNLCLAPDCSKLVEPVKQGQPLCYFNLSHMKCVGTYYHSSPNCISSFMLLQIISSQDIIKHVVWAKKNVLT